MVSAASYLHLHKAGSWWVGGCIVMPSQDEFIGLCYRLDLLGCCASRLYLLINFDAMFKTLPKPPPEPPLLPPLPPPICDFK